jgi:hypothetical protein
MGNLLTNKDCGLLDLFLEQVFDDFISNRKTRTETLNVLQSFITSLDDGNRFEIDRTLLKADARSRGA